MKNLRKVLVIVVLFYALLLQAKETKDIYCAECKIRINGLPLKCDVCTDCHKKHAKKGCCEECEDDCNEIIHHKRMKEQEEKRVAKYKLLKVVEEEYFMEIDEILKEDNKYLTLIRERKNLKKIYMDKGVELRVARENDDNYKIFYKECAKARSNYYSKHGEIDDYISTNSSTRPFYIENLKKIRYIKKYLELPKTKKEKFNKQIKDLENEIKLVHNEKIKIEKEKKILSKELSKVKDKLILYKNRPDLYLTDKDHKICLDMRQYKRKLLTKQFPETIKIYDEIDLGHKSSLRRELYRYNITTDDKNYKIKPDDKYLEFKKEYDKYLIKLNEMSIKRRDFVNQSKGGKAIYDKLKPLQEKYNLARSKEVDLKWKLKNLTSHVASKAISKPHKHSANCNH